MNGYRLLAGKAAPERVLGSEKEKPTLQQHRCHRCGKAWWPRTLSKPARCPGCKSPYWDRPRRMRHEVGSLEQGGERLTNDLRRAVTQGLRNRTGQQREDRSLAKALSVLKEMKAAGRTWQEMAERVEREFGTRLDKDQLKALVR